MAEPLPGLGIVVVSYGSSHLLGQNLAGLDVDHLRARGIEPVVVVVDNPTSPAERTAVGTLAREHGWDLVTPAVNVGFGAGADLGAERALGRGCDRLLVLNPDVCISAAAVAELVEAHAGAPEALLTPRLDRPDGSVWFAGGQLDRGSGRIATRPDHDQQGPDRWLTGASLLVGAAAWSRLGGFDPGYFLYWEDVDLSQRALAAGLELRVVHDVVAVHDVGGTQGAGGKSAVYAHHMCRNRLRFAADHLDRRGRRRWARHSVRYAWWVVTRDGRRSFVSRPDLVWAALRGTGAGLASLLVGRRAGP